MTYDKTQLDLFRKVYKIAAREYFQSEKLNAPKSSKPRNYKIKS